MILFVTMIQLKCMGIFYVLFTNSSTKQESKYKYKIQYDSYYYTSGEYINFTHRTKQCFSILDQPFGNLTITAKFHEILARVLPWPSGVCIWYLNFYF